MLLIRTLRNSKGMTLIEMMMAVAIFGILLMTCGNVYTFIHNYNADTLDQLRMTELAQTEIEKAKVGIIPTFPSSGTLYYPNDSKREHEYQVKYENVPISTPATNPTVVGDLYKITMGNEYMHFTWMPKPNKIFIASSPSIPPNIFDSNPAGTLLNWNVTTGAPANVWQVTTDAYGSAIFNKPSGTGSEPLIFYKSISPYKSFHYIVSAKIPTQYYDPKKGTYENNSNLGNNEFAGIAILDSTTSHKSTSQKYYCSFGLLGRHSDISFRNSGLHSTNEHIDLGDYLFQFNKKYYLEAVITGAQLTFKFGYEIENGTIKNPVVTYPVPDFYDPNKPGTDGYYLGLYDSTSDKVVYFEPITFYDSGDSCDID